MDIQEEIKSLIKKAVTESSCGDLLEEVAEISVESSKDRGYGHLFTNIALVLAQKRSRPPLEIAQEIYRSICQELPLSRLADKIEKVECKGAGFINFFFSKGFLYESLREILSKKHNYGRNNCGRGKKVHLEFVSANPTGPLNVAHGRQAAFGDTLANLLEFSGYAVTREYYLNDAGVQIELLGESIRAKYLGFSGVSAPFPSSGYQGAYIDVLAQGLFKKYGRRLTQSINKRPDFFCRYAMGEILKEIKTDLKAFGVRYDSWFSQKKLDKSGQIEQAITLLKKKGFIYQKEGAWWLAATKFGDDKDRVVIKSDGKLTYIAPDIAYHRMKFKRGFAKLINIWGPDHHGYIPRLKAAVCASGYNVGCLEILIVQFVSLVAADKIIPMSTRQGQYITLAELLQAVGKDAARFFFLMRKRDAHLQFDLGLAKRQSLENPVYYIQYAYARTANILKHAQQRREPICPFHKALDLSLLDKPEELNLIRALSEFPGVIEFCTLHLEPHRVTAYLQELAKVFHHYYEKYRVVTEDNRLSGVRLLLVKATRIVLNNGLRLLAVSAPEKM